MRSLNLDSVGGRRSLLSNDKPTQTLCRGVSEAVARNERQHLGDNLSGNLKNLSPNASPLQINQQSNPKSQIDCARYRKARKGEASWNLS